MRSIDIWRVEDGRFVEHWDELNTLDAFIQIGAVPPTRQPTCLSLKATCLPQWLPTRRRSIRRGYVRSPRDCSTRKQVVTLDPIGKLGQICLRQQDAARFLHARHAGGVDIRRAPPEDR
jgi:hypothetical protein